MSAKGTPAWYRRNDVRPPFDPIAERDRLRNAARANCMFHEQAERQTFEAFFADSRRSRGQTYLAIVFERDAGGFYLREEVQRHWHTWTMSVGAGRLLPKFDPIKIAADRLAKQGS